MALHWTLLENGVEVQQGQLEPIQIAAGENRSYRIALVPFRPGKEYVLRTHLQLIRPSGLLEAGHELAFEQFELQAYLAPDFSVQNKDPYKLDMQGDRIHIQNVRTRLVLNRASGEIVHWSHGGELITEEAIRPNFWRPPTDNDLGNGMHQWAAIWKRATEEAGPVLSDPPAVSPQGVSFALEYQLPEDIASLKIAYLLSGDGKLRVDYLFAPRQDSLPNIPRLGMYLTLPPSFTEISWYGRGPHETYWDRKTSGKIGIHSGAIQEQFHRYPRPQETGNKTDIRWMQASAGFLTLRAYPADSQLLNGSIWPFSTSELEYVEGKAGGKSASGLVPVSSRHGADIRTGEMVQWNIDHRQMGVGGDTSWGRPVHPEYTIPAGEYSYAFWLIPEIP
jgi:beta-galactosidase